MKTTTEILNQPKYRDQIESDHGITVSGIKEAMEEYAKLRSRADYDQLITEINYIRDVEIKHLESKIQDACHVINELYDIIMDDTVTMNGVNLEFAEEFLIENFIPVSKDDSTPPDDLPF